MWSPFWAPIDIPPSIILFGSIIIGMILSGLAFDFWQFRKQWMMGLTLIMLAICILSYGLFCPLLLGRYVWPW